MKKLSRKLLVGLCASALLFSVTGHLGAGEGWQWLRTPGYWETQYGGIADAYDGLAWYRCFAPVPEAWRGKRVFLLLGHVYDSDQTFLNGIQVGETGSIEPPRQASQIDREYELDPRAIRFGEHNLIAIRVYNDQEKGGIRRGPVVLRSSAGVVGLRGTWQIRFGDDLAWARWPVPPDSPEARERVASFLEGAGPRFGKLVEGVPLAGTSRLTFTGDLASELVAGVDRFLLGKLAQSVKRRAALWHRDLSSRAAYDASIEPQRQRLARIIGAADTRKTFESMEYIASTEQSARVGEGRGFEAFAVRWPVLGDMHGEGLLLVPRGGKAACDIVAIPDADQTPEMLAGLVEGVAAESQFARRLAESGCRVVVPALISRGVTHRRLTNREFLYRPAFELGRHIIGYEVQKVLAVVDGFAAEARGKESRVGVMGWGEGGLLALYAGALDGRIDATCVSGYFDSRQDVWQEPIYRNVFGLLREFGDAELSSLIAPRTLVVEAAAGPGVLVPPGTGGAPGRLLTPELEGVRAEVERARQLTSGLEPPQRLELVDSGSDGRGAFGSRAALEAFLGALSPELTLAPSGPAPRHLRRAFRPEPRQAEQMHEIDRHNQWLLRESPYVRQKFLSRLVTDSLETYTESVKAYREYFSSEVIGRFDEPLREPNVRSRKVYDEEDLVGYEVVLDVFEDVMAYGILLLPKDMEAGERRPVVVCQHGLEGRPRDVADPNIDHHNYHQFAAQLTRRGFITFAPQNLYIFRGRFRQLQRKANPLGKTLFSVMVPQHQQIVDWLATLPYVDPERIAFYGLSYGGVSAMRIPPLVERYCLSICSAAFNDWVDVTASTRNPHSYVYLTQYEIFEFDLGSTFNSMEMAALIAPRPFMVERGHFDGVADDDTVAHEFARVRYLYAARLKIPERCAIEWFNGPHTIHGRGTFDFLHRHLRWPER